MEQLRLQHSAKMSGVLGGVAEETKNVWRIKEKCLLVGKGWHVYKLICNGKIL